jgi:tetratricopeptide (TPR) repeat protein
VRVTLALLADYALAHDDGKLYITGGGLHQLRFGRLPAIYERLCLALEIQFDPSEFGAAHVFAIDATDPLGQPFLKPAVLTVTSPPASIQTSSNRTQLVYNMLNLTFQHEGEHIFNVHVGAEVQAALPLRVAVVPGTSTEMSALLHRVAEGFAAFGASDLDAAEEHFRAVTETMPSLAVAHNNLGFVRLTKGKVEEALATFKKAQETGFDRPELLEANMACCYYLLGVPAASLALYENCLTARSLVGTSVLHGLSSAGPFLVQLPSAAAYARLMALNAGWSAWRAALPEKARNYLGMALGLTGIPADERLVQAMEELRANL